LAAPFLAPAYRQPKPGSINATYQNGRTQEGGLQIQFRPCLKPAQGRWHALCVLFAARRFATLGCYLHIHLLNDWPFLHRKGIFRHNVR
jgi:hypothetical protein